MGVYQEWAAELRVTKDAFASIKADPEFADKWIERAWDKSPKAAADWAIEDLAALISEFEGADDWGGESFTSITEDDEGWTLLGNDYGKVSYENDSFETFLAAHGVTGEIDFDCEGERGRTVFADGTTRITPGSTVYGDDFVRIMRVLDEALYAEGIATDKSDRIHEAVANVVDRL